MGNVKLRAAEKRLEAIMNSTAERASLRQADATELERLRAECATLRRLLARYRAEVPTGNQPHMLAHEVDEVLTPNRCR